MGERIQLPLELDDFDVLSSQVIDGVLEVHVESSFPTACFHCGSVGVVGHGRCRRRIRDRSVGRPTVLVWHQRRLCCRDCGRTSRERHLALAGRRSVTERFHRQLFEEACRRPFAEVASAHGVSHYRVVEAFDTRAPGAVGPVGQPRVLALDESAFRRRLRFNTVLFDPLGRRAISVADGRDQHAAELLLFSLPSAVRAGVETVVIDCHWPFRKAVIEAIPEARVVADKFHVLRSVDRAADRVRARAGHQKNYRGRDGGTARQNNPRNDPVVYGARWAFAKRRHTLNARQAEGLGVVFSRHPKVAVAWVMKEAFAAIYEAHDRAEAARRLAVWEHNLGAAGLPELDAVWRTLQWWREPILAHFEDRQTNAFAEGVTNKVKVMKRRSYGFRNLQRYRLKVLLTCSC
ncbi:MAG: ISL3 family transposase [Acidimicrobiia bacterium]|nr:ISL3 family transposase [Acidimicrobiia bacterium]MBV9284598.1 ISL3 family transposase [Acidimicrobiia bacterium]